MKKDVLQDDFRQSFITEQDESFTVSTTKIPKLQSNILTHYYRKGVSLSAVLKMLDVLVGRLDLGQGSLDQLPHVFLTVQYLSRLLVLVDVNLYLLNKLK